MILTNYLITQFQNILTVIVNLNELRNQWIFNEVFLLSPAYPQYLQYLTIEPPHNGSIEIKKVQIVDGCL